MKVRMMISFGLIRYTHTIRTKIANGIPIEGWTHDPSDEALLDLLPVLDSLRFTSDVRRVLGLRSAGVSYT
jgi:CTD nuclear envelope phosphatase 1